MTHVTMTRKNKWNKYVAEARKNYPNPVTLAEAARLEGTGCYCVGGALCKTLGFDQAFPTISALSRVLHLTNNELVGREASLRAKKIIDLNDSGKFDEAWKAADNALKYRPLLLPATSSRS